jgi:hypothetical protein
MRKSVFIAGAAVAGAMVMSLGAMAPAQAATFATFEGGCSVGDISPTAGQCNGFYQGNLLSNSPHDVADQTTALNALGLAGTAVIVEQHSSANTNDTLIDFNALLNGATYIGVHWGAGAGGPAPDVHGGVTGFYRLDLASNAQLDHIFSTFATTNSGYALFSTQPCKGDCGVVVIGGGAPEPAAWALMLVGFGGLGALLRKRRAQIEMA